MDLKNVFTTKRFGVSLDDWLRIIVACTFAMQAKYVLFPVSSAWGRLGIFTAGWIVGYAIYTMIRALVIMQYKKLHPDEDMKDEFEEIFNEYEKKTK